MKERQNILQKYETPRVGIIPREDWNPDFSDVILRIKNNVDWPLQFF